ncbi:MAG: type I methionyl aminopeptidase [Candidatus Doudnabacteria bacterium RIFCSPHIGHO2_01_FULL_45_18]|uniref:Methionine aminopeptidase n=1 Tax=Candidatus Doudnabacteria bacterium RIFCSPHIGHO2_01_FULL_45_18 TaxID=1817823 RepID=A0A1F5NR85_9BACT|nr:MAG: type I methionyl aminopeptidase [Candidatus Doudnabacteria bacterium RIFCSPHIGHO2_01_FULL_45_18]
MITQDPKEIEILRQGGKILAAVLNLVAAQVKLGVSAFELDQLAEKEIRARGATPSFKNYAAQPGDPPFPASLCVSVNDEVVHGIPTKGKILKEGDIVGLDLGVEYQGLFTDAAITVPVGKVEAKYLKLIEAAKESLTAGLAKIKAGNFTGDIGAAVESTAKKYRFQVVRELVGHGVGRAVHEEPEVPGFGKPKTGTKLVAGMVLAIEPMINAGSWKIYFADDKWTIKTYDHSRSSHMEHTILVTDMGYEILTKI